MADLDHSLEARGSTRSHGLPYPRWAEVSIVALIWCGYSILRFVQFYIQESAPNHYSINYTFKSLLFLSVTLFLFYLCSKIRPNERGWSISLLSHILLFLFITSSVEILATYVKIWKVEVMGTGEFIPDSYGLIEVVLFVFSRLKFTNQVEPYLIAVGTALGRDYFLRYTNEQARAHELREHAHQLQNQLTSARLDALRMQINPHFLFNTLHVINTMADTNPDGVRRATKRLSELLRYALSSSEEQEVPLAKELKFLRGYFDIQKLRLRDHLNVEIDVDPSAKDALVPTLLLQPLAENAVKHGIQHVEETGVIRIQVRRQGQTLVVRVEDNGPGVTGDPSGNGCVGLNNVRERLTHLYGADRDLTLDDSRLGGCCVEVRLPYHTDRDPYFEAVPDSSREPVSASSQ